VPRVSPFRGLTYDVSVAGPLDRLTAPPYDVISDPHREGLSAGSPRNVVHLDLAEGPADPDAVGNRYDRAAELLRSWRTDGTLILDPEPGYHAYEMRFELGGRMWLTRGIFVAMDLEPWGGDVLPHEDTMSGPVVDRLCLLRATRTHISAVYGTIAGPVAPLRDLLDARTAEPADVHLTDDEGVRHRLWRLDADVPVRTWLADRHLLIADGHHRYTTALAYRDERRDASGPGPWDRILTLIVDAATEHVPVLPYHRVQIAGTPPPEGEPMPSLAALLDALDDDTLRFGTVRLTGGTLRFQLHTAEGRPPTVRALHRALDAYAPGDALRFTHDVGDGVSAVERGGAVATYLLPATSPRRILEVVEAGDRLPRKSTFFWPKPRTGMVMMPIGDG
jgi:uncharacterized protein (DUF1015 family)